MSGPPSLPPERLSTGDAKKRVLESLREMPIVAHACKRAGISKATYYRWLQKDGKFSEASREALHHGIEFINDMSEAQVITLIKEKKMPAITLWLKHNHPNYRPQHAARPQERPQGLVALIKELEARDQAHDEEEEKEAERANELARKREQSAKLAEIMETIDRINKGHWNE